MTTARPFDPAAPVAPGRTLIEASAGTGKTFTIASQVARLVADDGLPIERILVVTFTRAATAELEDRVRTRMVDAVRALIDPALGERGDAHMAVLLEGDEPTLELRRSRLADALTGFDRAPIYTIHGFALRVLVQLGFYARVAADLEPADVDARLIRSVVADLLVDRFADDAADLVPHRDLVAIGEAVTTKPDASIVPDPGVGGLPGLRAELAGALRDRIGRRLRAAGVVGYDQMLIAARDALADPAVGGAARAVMQKRFDVALVDESQDTDPIQWQIIRAIFDDSRRLVLIGDPKQSIYAFRGADVESYLSAAAGAERRTLPTNWRSDGPLIDALNALFDGTTFGDERIGYLEVEPAPSHVGARIIGPGAPLTIRRFGDDFPLQRQASNVSFFYKPEAREAVAADVAAQIVVLLGSGTRISDDEGPFRPVGPGDIAVLCRTRNQVQLVRDALTARGVPSVAARSGSVFVSPAAEQWRRFLHGVERPDIVTRVRLAATSDLVGLDLAGLAALDDAAVVALQARMRDWRDLLHESGVPALLAAVDRHSNLAARLLGRPDGERTLTDLTHLAEAMHQAWRTRRVGSLLSWLEDQMAEADANEADNAEEPEARQRRLETDAEAVQVQTIHAAKGLEYPIVFCPYLWDQIGAPRDAVKVPVFHEGRPQRTDGDSSPRRRLIDVGGGESPGFAEHLARSAEEEAGEEARLLYVAMTRARHRLYVWWVIQADGTRETKLHEILTRRGGLDLRELIAASGGTIAEEVVDDVPGVERYEPAAAATPELSRARLDRRLDYEWRRVSYSSLSPDHPVTPVADGAEQQVKGDEREPDEAEIPEETALPMGSLPHGLRFGTLVHEALENVPFDAEDLDRAVSESVSAAMAPGRWDFPPEELAGALAAAIRTPLDVPADGNRLRDLPESRLRKEMWFHLPVRTGAAATSLAEIGAIVRDHLAGGDPLRGYAEHLAGLSATRFRGFLTGAIDLTAAVPSGDEDRYVVMDFKSNVIPPTGEVAVAEDYAVGRMRREMERSHYLLQSLLYQVALHRYLQWRLPGYDPARHLGGSAYLFLRGMAGPDTPVVDGERCGVFWWRPPPEMIAAVSRLLSGEEQE